MGAPCPHARFIGLAAGIQAAESALLLGHYFGMSPEFWMNHQAQHDLALARSTMGPKLQAVRARPPVPLAEA